MKKKLKSWQVAIFSALGLLALYYLIIPIIGPHFAEVCRYSEHDDVDYCSKWDAVTAVVLNLFNWLDTHNGAVTAFAGVAVALFTFALYASTEKLWGEARRQREDVRKGGMAGVITARAALRSSRAAEKSADNAEKQMLIVARQTDIIEKQKEISRLQFFAEHRPRLVLKDVFFSQAGSYDELSFEIANIGGSLAVIENGFVALNHVDDPRQFKDVKMGSLAPLDNNGFLPADVRSFAIRSSEEIKKDLTDKLLFLRFPDLKHIRVEHPAQPRGAIYFFGLLRYSDTRPDGQKVTYLSVFRREFDPESDMFVRTGNPDHEYSD